jgi:hypothetical protein
LPHPFLAFRLHVFARLAELRAPSQTPEIACFASKLVGNRWEATFSRRSPPGKSPGGHDSSQEVMGHAYSPPLCDGQRSRNIRNTIPLGKSHLAPDISREPEAQQCLVWNQTRVSCEENPPLNKIRVVTWIVNVIIWNCRRWEVANRRPLSDGGH